MFPLRFGIDLAERGWVPVGVLRLGMRGIIQRRLQAETRRARSIDDWIREMSASPVAIATDRANAQHYEMPVAFFELVLGPALKYSRAYWPDGVTTLAEAERAMLRLTIERADLHDGQRILELGCGWGSLTLAMARTFPAATVLAVSNSHRQRDFILRRAKMQGLSNVEIVTADMNAFRAAGAQLARFKRAPASTGQVMDRGLWRYSRHPNYFGDCLLWWGFGLFGVAGGGMWPLIGPTLMTVLLVNVSGVALLESTIADRRPACRAYIRRTSAFVPWPPRDR